MQDVVYLDEGIEEVAELDDPHVILADMIVKVFELFTHELVRKFGELMQMGVSPTTQKHNERHKSACATKAENLLTSSLSISSCTYARPTVRNSDGDEHDETANVTATVPAKCTSIWSVDWVEWVGEAVGEEDESGEAGDWAVGVVGLEGDDGLEIALGAKSNANTMFAKRDAICMHEGCETEPPRANLSQDVLSIVA
ncbi:hypothetical protein L1987_85738 [Smallanthus sonchifolius]|uniref:Uncharacterized protein n=1 Tax=Smallanthus sonchifolius TaxID=185202 RepID=A0ACB8XY07_9ASTR|nr:hypothetical protein L1987_85738 [Smallanthus sonchifolius]